MDEKFRRSRVHVVHVKDPSAVENRERVGDYAAVLAKFKIEKPSQVEKEKKYGRMAQPDCDLCPRDTKAMCPQGT